MPAQVLSHCPAVINIADSKSQLLANDSAGSIHFTVSPHSQNVFDLEGKRKQFHLAVPYLTQYVQIELESRLHIEACETLRLRGLENMIT